MRLAALEYASLHRGDYLETLKELLRIPSISTLPEHAVDVAHAAAWVESYLHQIGLANVHQIATPGQSMVYGEWLSAESGRPTLLIYGHYDVQPVDPIELWKSPPFEPTIRGDDIFCRGVADDKGLFFAMLAGLDAYLRTSGRLPINIKVLLEGEEEISSPNIAGVVREHRDLLAADACVISDQPMFAPDQPTICYGVRGGCYFEIQLRGPAIDFHSGTVGGGIENPFNALVRLLAKVQGDDYRIQIPGFYERVIPLDDEEKRVLAQAPVEDSLVIHFTGVPAVAGEPGFTSAERISVRPTFEIHGMPGGFTGAGKKSVIPSLAGAKVSFRLVPDQTPEEIATLFENYLRANLPPTVTMTVRRFGESYPVLLNRKHPAIQAADRAYQHGFGFPAVYFRAGGSLPIVHELVEQLNAPVALIGFGLPDDNLHAPNEKLHLPNFYKGIDTAIHYYAELAAMREAR